MLYCVGAAAAAGAAARLCSAASLAMARQTDDSCLSLVPSSAKPLALYWASKNRINGRAAAPVPGDAVLLCTI